MLSKVTTSQRKYVLLRNKLITMSCKSQSLRLTVSSARKITPSIPVLHVVIPNP